MKTLKLSPRDTYYFQLYWYLEIVLEKLLLD